MSGLCHPPSCICRLAFGLWSLSSGVVGTVPMQGIIPIDIAAVTAYMFLLNAIKEPDLSRYVVLCSPVVGRTNDEDD